MTEAKKPEGLTESAASVSAPATDVEQINAGCRHVTPLLQEPAPAPSVEAQAVSASDLLEILEPLSKVYPTGSVGREKVERVIAALKEPQQ